MIVSPNCWLNVHLNFCFNLESLQFTMLEKKILQWNRALVMHWMVRDYLFAWLDFKTGLYCSTESGTITLLKKLYLSHNTDFTEALTTSDATANTRCSQCSSSCCSPHCCGARLRSKEERGRWLSHRRLFSHWILGDGFCQANGFSGETSRICTQNMFIF